MITRISDNGGIRRQGTGILPMMMMGNDNLNQTNRHPNTLQADQLPIQYTTTLVMKEVPQRDDKNEISTTTRVDPLVPMLSVNITAFILCFGSSNVGHYDNPVVVSVRVQLLSGEHSCSDSFQQ